MREFDKLILIQRVAMILSFGSYVLVMGKEGSLAIGLGWLIGSGFFVYFYKNPNKVSEKMYTKDKKYWTRLIIMNLAFFVISMGLPIFVTGFNIIVLAVVVPLVLTANGLSWYQTNVVFSESK